MSVSILQRYRELVAAGRLEPDPAQIALIERLDALAGVLDGYTPRGAPNAFERLIGVRPVEARPDSPRGVEIGKLDDKGAFTAHGLLSPTGKVTNLAVAVDAIGTLWIYYTDAMGSWLERRVCPSG